MLPTASELTRIRDDIEAATFPDTCTIQSVTQTSDGQGGYTDSWATAASNVACRLDVSKTSGPGIYGKGTVKAASFLPFSTWVLSVPHGTNITKANRVVCNGVTFNVTEVDAGVSWAGAVRCTLEKV